MGEIVRSIWMRLRRVLLVLGMAFLLLWGGADAAICVASLGRVYSKATMHRVLQGEVTLRRTEPSESKSE